MPIYYFDIQDGKPLPDLHGRECSDVSEMKAQALVRLTEQARNQLVDGDSRTLSVIVLDEDRRPVFVATIAITALQLA